MAEPTPEPAPRGRPGRRRRPIARRLRLAIALLIRRLDRRPPPWLRGLTPWATSLAAHGLGLFILGLIVLAIPIESRRTDIRARFGVDDLTTLIDSDHAGDPFTPALSTEPPSLTIEPAPDASATNTPEMPADARLASTLTLASPSTLSPAATVGGKGSAAPGAGPADAGFARGRENSAPFVGRRAESKAKMLRREGGSVESERAVEQGLDWLARHQRRDGGWSLDTTGQCDPRLGGCPPRESMVSDVGATGLALLPMLAAGHTHDQKGRYQESVRAGLRYLMKSQGQDGLVSVGGTPIGTIYAHAIATMAMSEAFGLTGDKRLGDHAQKGVNWLVRNQNRDDGGWRYYPGQPGDTSVFGWAVFALRSASLSGLNVPRSAARRCRQYLDLAAADKPGSTYSYMPGGPATSTMTAEGLLGRQYLGWPRDHPAMLQGTALLVSDLRQSPVRNMYYWYYATQLLHNLQGKDWEGWNLFVREKLIASQVGGKGCDRGSWDPSWPEPDRNGHLAGRLYQTSLSLLTLEVYYRYLPLYRLNSPELASDPDPDPKGTTNVESPEPTAAARR